MIKKVTLLNFQAHGDTEIDFKPGVNVIVGPSDRGKSAIIRALQLIFFNRPGGKAYIKHGTKECRVEVDMASGDTISRARTKSKNYYQINDNDPLKAPGRDVPREVTDICNMQEINFQGQHDMPFMLAETAGECGRMLNRCVDLTVIDKTLNKLNTEKRNASSNLQFVEDELATRFAACNKYSGVAELRKEIDALHAISGALEHAQQEYMASITLLASCVKMEEQLKDVPDMSGAMKALTAHSTDATRIDSKYRKVKELRNALSGARNAQEALTDTEDVKEALSEIESVLEASKGYETKEEKASNLQIAHTSVSRCQRMVRECLEAEKELKEELAELMGDACPLCGAPTEGGKA